VALAHESAGELSCAHGPSRILYWGTFVRIIAGKYRSRAISSMPGLNLRPTSDRLRETLFNVLCSGNPAALHGTSWLDLYAGTGAVGIEALSRGASRVIFVESSPKAASLIEENLRALGLTETFQIVRADVSTALPRCEAIGVAADYVFLDPPYRMRDEYARTLTLLSVSRLVGQTSIVVAEHEKRFDPGAEFGQLQRYRELVQGDAALSFYRKV
jgi:16S rRNA (guanine966-N2)-methyltransferase